MSKPALGRGLASLLQEETDRGAVNAPGLTPLKEAPVAQPVPGPEVVSAATPFALPTHVSTPNPTEDLVAHSADEPILEQERALRQTILTEAIKPVSIAPNSTLGSRRRGR